MSTFGPDAKLTDSWLTMAATDKLPLSATNPSIGSVGDHDVYFLSYPSKGQANSDLAQIVAGLATTLSARINHPQHRELLLSEYDHIVVVAHSLGGIAVMGTLEELYFRYNTEPTNLRSANPLFKIKGLFFYGVPAAGAPLAEGLWGQAMAWWASLIGSATSPTDVSQKLTEEFTRTGTHRRHINARWRGALDAIRANSSTKKHPGLYCFNETQPVPGASTLIGERERNPAGCSNQEDLNFNHFGIVRPESPSSSIYTRFRQRLHDLLQELYPRETAQAATQGKAQPCSTEDLFSTTGQCSTRSFTVTMQRFVAPGCLVTDPSTGTIKISRGKDGELKGSFPDREQGSADFALRTTGNPVEKKGVANLQDTRLEAYINASGGRLNGRWDRSSKSGTCSGILMMIGEVVVTD